MVTETETAPAAATANSADTLRHAYAHWREAKHRHDTLKNRLEENELSKMELQKQMTQMQERRPRIIDDVMARILDHAALTTADADLQTLQDRKTEAEKVWATTRVEFEQAEVDYNASRKAAELAREKFCIEQAAPMEIKIREDKNLRRRLIEAFAAIVAAVDPELPTTGVPNWQWFIRELFLEPTDAELAEPVARFKHEHLAPLTEAK